MALGVLVYVIVVAAGLGVVVARHAEVVTVLQVFGASYLGWLARGMILDARHIGTPAPPPAATAPQRHCSCWGSSSS